MQQWRKGIPEKAEDDRMYAVLRRSGDSGVNLGIVARGEDITWTSPLIVAHWPLPFEMDHIEARKLRREGLLQ